jgi:hypothetical protein
MNLFRSEEHVRRWAQFNPMAAEGVIALADLAVLFSTASRHHLLDSGYVSRWLPQRERERQEALARLGKTTPFWRGQT